jgi:Spy/CpxP family protein refolding chaperone
MAQTSDPTAARISPYAGEQARTIMSLSEEDLAELRRGGGWGLARAAELHGVPGPKHLLELADEIPLRAEQVEAIQTIFEQMRADAILAGRRFIEAEAALDDAFRRGSVDHDSLRALLDEVAARRSELRRVHLAAHLDTRPILSAEQIERYKRLRGYSDDACDRVPDVHDPAMWRRHHGCE